MKRIVSFLFGFALIACLHHAGCGSGGIGGEQGNPATFVGNTTVPKPSNIVGGYAPLLPPPEVQEKFDVQVADLPLCERAPATLSSLESVNGDTQLLMNNFISLQGDFQSLTLPFSSNLKSGKVDAFATSENGNNLSCKLQILQVDSMVYTLMRCEISGAINQTCGVSMAHFGTAFPSGALADSTTGKYKPVEGHTCRGGPNSSDVDELEMYVAGNEILYFENDDDLEEVIYGVSGNTVKFTYLRLLPPDYIKSEVTGIDCELTFSGDGAKGFCQDKEQRCEMVYKKEVF